MKRLRYASLEIAKTDADNLSAGAERRQPKGKVKKYFEILCIVSRSVAAET